MLRSMFNGFCMALADSVPGVSGGTVAFIMGFYDQFIGSIHNLAFGNHEQKKTAIRYLIKLGCGWAIGMIAAVFVLSALFESHIYMVSSLFIGFIAGAIPLMLMEERQNVREWTKGIIFLVLGIVLVAGITWLNGQTATASMDLTQFSIPLAIRLFFIGMIAISAMFLPGISGSTLLLIFGAYIPVITAIKAVLTFQLAYIPNLSVFGLGIITGALFVVKLIKVCLEKFRTQTIYAILGMMMGSFYAIIMGPMTLHQPQPALSFSTFNWIAAIIGLVLVLGLQKIKESEE